MHRDLIATRRQYWTCLSVVLFSFHLSNWGWSADQPAANSNDANNKIVAEISAPVVGTRTSQEWSGNSLNLKFLWCEPGNFIMGSPASEPDRVADEEQVPVEITKGFWLGQYEVTQAQWRAVMNTEPWIGEIRVRIAPDSPACWVSWDQSHLFCRELNERERKSGALPNDWEYALPTEAQWEYACRAGTTTKFSYGDDNERLEDYAWYGEQERQPQQMNARAVGRKKPNPWGFYDIHGNVVEWCRDWYHPKYPGGKDPFMATDFNHFVTLRGGEWRRELNWSRSACRQHLLPAGRAATVGLRVLLQQRDPGSVAPVVTTKKIAVVSFENRGTSVSYERVGSALSGMLASDLSRLAALDVLERQSAQEIRDEKALAKAGATQDQSAGQKAAFADYIMTGTCSITDQKMTITARLSEAGIEKPLNEWTLKGTVDDLFRLEKELTEQIISTLKVAPDLRQDPPAIAGDSPVTAILPLSNNSPSARLDDMRIGFAELLQANLGEVKGIRLVERKQIEQILAEQKLALGGQVDAQTAAQAGKLLGAQRLLTGSFLEIGKQLSIQIRIINSATGAVVSSSQATGPSDDCSQLIDNLSQNVITSLQVAALAKSPDTDKATPFGRSLESTVYSLQAARFQREGNLPKAAEAYQQALLIEPYHIQNHVHLMRAQMDLNDYEGAAKTGEHGLAFPKEFNFCHVNWKHQYLNLLVYAYLNSRRFDDVVRLLNEYGDLSEGIRTDLTRAAVSAYIKQKRFPHAAEVMVKMADKDVEAHGIIHSEGLRTLYQFYVEHSISVVGIPIKDHQIASKKAIEIYERVLDAVKDSRDPKVADWANTLIPSAREILTISDDNQRVPFLTPAQKEKYQQREIEIFSWMPQFGADPIYESAVRKENAKEWAAAVDLYRKFLDNSTNLCTDYVNPQAISYYEWNDKRIESQYRIAFIQKRYLNQKNEAIKSYQDFVREFGLANFAATDVLIEMHKLKITPETPADSALVWGGSNSNLIGWRHLLATENLRMHSARKPILTLADLAPYRLVVLNRAEEYPLAPSEALALHSYVASGGSLLVVASPQWHASAPILLNSVLSMFKMEADATAIPEARSTNIVKHPITTGITSFNAWQAVNLRVPKETALIQAGDATILAATQHGHGRLVVAAHGPWLTPEILLIPENEQLVRKTLASAVGAAQNFEFYRGKTPEPPLLRQTLRWLGEARPSNTAFETWQREWRSSLLTFSQAQARIVPKESRLVDWDSLPKVFDRLISNAPTADLKELSLWAAGESLLEKGYFEFAEYPTGFNAKRGHLRRPQSSRITLELTLSCYPKYFKRLVDEFKDSPLRDDAQLRLADTQRHIDPRQGRQLQDAQPAVILKMAAPYEKLSLAKGTYAQAWQGLNRGLLYFAANDWERAAKAFDEVADSMPISAEKEIAIVNAAKCYGMLGEFQEGRRRLTQLDGLPNMNWTGAEFEYYRADSESTFHHFYMGLHDTRHFSTQFAECFKRMEKDEVIQKRFADRQKTRAKK